MRERRPYTEEEVARILELYKTLSRPQVAAEMGIPVYRVNHILKVKNARISREEFSRRQSEGLKRMYARERRRIESGQEQKVGHALRQEPLHIQRTIARLAGRYSYFRNAKYPYTLFYDEQTRRTTNEQYFTDKYNLRFVDAR